MQAWFRTGMAALAALVVMASAASAADKRIINLNLFTQNDLRAMAMGNAFGPIARGETALFYNPAGLAQYDLDLKAEYSVNVAGSDKFALDTYETAGSDTSTSDLLDYLLRYEDTTQTFTYNSLLSGVANLGYTNLGVGYGSLDAHRYSLKFTNGGTQGQLDFTDELAIADAHLEMQSAAVAFKLGRGKVLLGLAAKPFVYSEGLSVQTYDQIVNNSGELDIDISTNEYTAATVYDLGMLYRLEFWPKLKPQMSLTAYNLGGGEIKNSKTAEVVQILPSYNVGFAFGPDTGFVHWLVSFEFEDITDALKTTDYGNTNLPCNDVARTETCTNQSRSLLQRTHIGAEIGFFQTPTGNNIVSLRAGNNRGYFTYGAELNFWILRLLYARGADNLGWVDNPEKFEFTAYQVGIAAAW